MLAPTQKASLAPGFRHWGLRGITSLGRGDTALCKMPLFKGLCVCSDWLYTLHCVFGNLQSSKAKRVGKAKIENLI